MSGAPAGRSNPPSVLLFDWDNTLVDNWATIHEALNAALTAMGHAPWSFDEALARVRESLRDSFPRMFGDRWEEARSIFYETFRRTHLETLKPIAGATEALEALATAGVPMGVVSNKTGDLLRAEVAHLGWDGHFTNVVGAGDASADKPDPAPIRLALAGTHALAGPAVWYVGDAAIDIACARAAGCTGVLITAGRVHPEEAIEPPPDKRVNGFAELVALAAPGQSPI